MAGKKQNAAQLKAAKQKKIVIGGAVLLVGLMVIQGPKMLKLMSGGSSASAAAPAATPLPGAPLPGAVPAAPGTPAPAATTSTKLVSFERFSSKDPFSAQIVAPTTASNDDAGTSGSATTATPAGTAGASAGAGVTLVPKATTSTSKSSTEKTVMKTIQVNGTPTNGYAQIKVNGKTETVNKSKDFPKSDPTFTLTAVNADGSVSVSIAGGSLKAGGKTFQLYEDVPKTLLNTADGTRYTLVLVSATLPTN